MSVIDCAVCGAASVESGTACQACHAPPGWQDLFQATRLASEQYVDLHKRDLLDDAEIQHANEILSSMQLQWSQPARQTRQPPGDSGLRPPLNCRQCGRVSSAAQKFCVTCGGPTGARAERLRYMDFSLSLFTNHIAAGLSADRAQRCIDELRARISTIENELKENAAAERFQAAAMPLHSAHKNLAEILLDPHSIRWLLGSGGVLLTVGLVIFLSSLGIFKNAMVVASAMGVGTLATLVGGIVMIRLTRHSLAGRAMALLGCLVMPLNLWFYNSNHLVMLDGHLWVAATMCCAIYAAAAFVLEDPMFVYVLFGGITMTGMLVLGDLHRLVEISAPETLLITLGLISLHAEHAFADDDGPFSRKRFGTACFWSAHALIGLGLVLLLVSQVAACSANFGSELSQIVALPGNHFLGLTLVLAGGYGYFYSSLVVRRNEIYGYFAVVCLLWAELLGIQIGHLTNHLAVLLSALALTSLAMNIAASLLWRKEDDRHRSLGSPLPLLGFGLIALALAMGLLPHVHAVFVGIGEIPQFNITWKYLAAMALIAISSRIAAFLTTQKSERPAIGYLVTTAGATFIAVCSILALTGLNTWPIMATVLMTIPIVYLLASRLHKDGPAKRSLPTIAGAAAVVLIFSGLIVENFQWISPIVGQTSDLWLATFSLEAAIFFAIAAAVNRSTYNIYFSTVMLCGMIYRLLSFWAFPNESYDIAIAAAGIAGLIGRRFLSADIEGNGQTGALFACANGLASIPMVGVMLMTLSRLAVGHMSLSMLWTPTILSVLALVSAALVPAGGVRRWYVALTFGQIALAFITLAQYSTVSLPRKFELFSVMAGVVLLVVGYGLWYRQQNGKSDGAALCLLFGALMAGLPPAIFAIVNRFGFEISFADELTLVTIAVLMFLTGIMARVRATTLIGGGLLICHLITLVIFTGMKAQLALGAYVAIGGAMLFIIGLLLSVYRDRLLAMPGRIKERNGIFSVLAWR